LRTSITSPIANSNLQFVPCLGCLTTSKCRNFFDLQLIYCHALYTCSAANLVRCKLSSAIMKLLCFRTLDLRLTSTSSGISESHSKAFVLQPHTVSVLLGCFGFLVCGEAYEPKTTIASSVLLFSNLGLHYGSVILAKFDDVSILPLLWNSEYKKLRIGWRFQLLRLCLLICNWGHLCSGVERSWARWSLIRLFLQLRAFKNGLGRHGGRRGLSLCAGQRRRGHLDGARRR